jgi:hypothetical protein
MSISACRNAVADWQNSAWLIDGARYGSDRRTVRTCDVEAEEHYFGSMASERFEIRDMLGD